MDARSRWHSTCPHPFSLTAVVVLAGHFDVAVVAVEAAPAILNEPVVLALVRAIAHSEHGVVQVVRGVTASLVVVDALRVEAEALRKAEAGRWTADQSRLERDGTG